MPVRRAKACRRSTHRSLLNRGREYVHHPVSSESGRSRGPEGSARPQGRCAPSQEPVDAPDANRMNHRGHLRLVGPRHQRDLGQGDAVLTDTPANPSRCFSISATAALSLVAKLDIARSSVSPSHNPVRSGRAPRAPRTRRARELDKRVAGVHLKPLSRLAALSRMQRRLGNDLIATHMPDSCVHVRETSRGR
jgi:hypothetical protein